MYTYKELYGADADGNRGQMVTEAVLEPSDTPTIKELILKQYEEGVDTYTIILMDQFDEDIEFDVLASDYFNQDELEALDDSTINPLP
jgi:hypothetical protein